MKFGRQNFPDIQIVWLAGMLSLLAVTAGLAETVDAGDARAHVGETIAVRGRVAQVARIGSGMVFLNFGKPHPDSIFTAVAQPGFEGIDDWSIFESKTVEVSGTVELHKGKPQIVLRDVQSIRVVDAGSAFGSGIPKMPNPAMDGAMDDELLEPAVLDRQSVKKASKEMMASPGRMQEFKVTLTAEEKRLAGRSPAGVEPTEATVGVMLPADFDVSKPQKVLVVFATDDGGGAHVNAVPRFGRIANEAGWVAVAANGPALEKNLTPEWNAAMILAGLRALEEKFPGFGKAGFYTGGNSGGAARSSMMASALLANGYDVRGVFMGGAAGERFSAGMAIFPKSRAAVRKLAVFLSHGTEDHIVSRQMADANLRSIKGLGIRTVRQDSYEGGHGMNEDSLRRALAWFADLSGKIL